MPKHVHHQVAGSISVLPENQPFFRKVSSAPGQTWDRLLTGRTSRIPTTSLNRVSNPFYPLREHESEVRTDFKGNASKGFQASIFGPCGSHGVNCKLKPLLQFSLFHFRPHHLKAVVLGSPQPELLFATKLPMRSQQVCTRPNVTCFEGTSKGWHSQRITT